MNKNRFALMTLISILFFFSFSCEKETTKENGDADYLAYGTSFVQCINYCKHQVVISGGIEYKKSGWNIDEVLPDSTCSLTFVQSPLPGYMENIDIDAFQGLNEIIGCPDCADGGAEWIEISIDNEVKRVTFEYMNEPDELKDVLPSLRTLMDSFNNCN